MKRILVVDDDAAHRMMLCAVLRDEGYAAQEAHDGAAAVEAVKHGFFDLVLMDVRMTEMDGIEALEAIRALSPGMAVLMMTAYPEVPAAVRAMKAGAIDFLTKPLDTDELRLRIAKLTGGGTQNAVDSAASAKLAAASRLLGDSEPMRQLFQTLALVAPTDATVLILGESGTGKELVAETIHANSPRAAQPMVKVNCAALPETLLESELFGHEKGAFTGAISRRKGRFELADGGTIFLDEIGDIPVAVQVKLLRVLQQQQFEPLGSSKTLRVNVRILAATNRRLEEEIAQGRFREDLYYRLNIFPVHVPPLRERKNDIARLAEAFLTTYRAKHGRPIVGFSPQTLDLLMRYDWRGNVRELENTVERSVILCQEEWIRPAHLPAPIQAVAKDAAAQPAAMTLKEMEQQLILSTLKQFEGNRTKTAEMLGISRRSLQMKLKELGMND